MQPLKGTHLDNSQLIAYVATYLRALWELIMSRTIMSSREFNQDAARAKRAAAAGPVFITDRGRPAHVLLSIDEYRRLAGPVARIADLLHAADAAEVAFEPPRLDDLAQGADLS